MPASTDDSGDLWAVLVAGSKTYMNYRHQADVCHAYQILHSHGVPDDHIIVMMFDDIANSPENPTPGKIINRPDGPDVYQGVPKDYTGTDVTPENFLKVLAGDTEGLKGVGSGKVLGSGPNDRVFINLVDHGAPGIFGFPTTFLYENDFTNAILGMSRNNQFKEMTIYLEACESGSMFKNLPDDINVYALSAANSTQSSYACYFDSARRTFLGDVFSIKWMEDTDREDVTKESLVKQFNIVAKETTTSQVLQFGQLSIDTQKVGQFVGDDQTTLDTFGPFNPLNDPCLNSSMASPDVPLATLQMNHNNAVAHLGADYWQTQVDMLQESRSFVRDTMRHIVTAVTGDSSLTDQMMTNNHHQIHKNKCYQAATNSFHDICFDLSENTYAMRVLYAIVNLCEHGYTADEFTTAARAVCIFDPITGII
ncbi:hypothetical protein Pmani_025113 [Petrolisthes manimaculis]|uniref:legumain n=1 Tax=Petrolisthes manimaculis TaxID=1843537 RepID=A0AAE1P8W9_9EUCA|nr:hypothetical protein Pmani_025113 [Petrolisthes manimaculis]